jgi:hypothetical protein
MGYSQYSTYDAKWNKIKVPHLMKTPVVLKKEFCNIKCNAYVYAAQDALY